jgi:hypothetical protein
MRKLLSGVLVAMTLLALSSTAASGAFPVLRAGSDHKVGPDTATPSRTMGQGVLPAPRAAERN